MKRSNRLILLIGVFFAVLAFIGVILLGQQGDPTGGPAAEPTTAPTVFAKRDIPLGVVVTVDMLRQDDAWLLTKREATAFADVTLVVGKIARRDIVKDKQLTAEDFQTSRGGGATDLSVPAGFGGFAVQVDQVTGVGTLINAGDYVDVVAQISTADQKFPVLYPVPVPGEEQLLLAKVPDEWYDHTSVKVLLQGVQVLATILPPPPADAGVADGVTLNGQQELVILAVTPQQAEILKFAQVDGSVSLVLRSAKDFVDAQGNPVSPEQIPTTGLVLKTMIDDWGVLPPELALYSQPLPTAQP